MTGMMERRRALQTVGVGVAGILAAGAAAGASSPPASLLPEGAGTLTVSLWMGRDSRIQSDALPLSMLEIA